MKVFISSTYKDLIEYRKAARQTLPPTMNLGMLQAAHNGSLRRRLSDRTLARCLKEVEESALIHRHLRASLWLYCLMGYDISITEMEFAHAKKLGRPFIAL